MKTSRMSSGDVCHGSVSRVVVEIQSTADTAVAHNRDTQPVFEVRATVGTEADRYGKVD